jgi:hypothetical protein
VKWKRIDTNNIEGVKQSGAALNGCIQSAEQVEHASSFVGAYTLPEELPDSFMLRKTIEKPSDLPQLVRMCEQAAVRHNRPFFQFVFSSHQTTFSSLMYCLLAKPGHHLTDATCQWDKNYAQQEKGKVALIYESPYGAKMPSWSEIDTFKESGVERAGAAIGGCTQFGDKVEDERDAMVARGLIQQPSDILQLVPICEELAIRRNREFYEFLYSTDPASFKTFTYCLLGQPGKGTGSRDCQWDKDYETRPANAKEGRVALIFKRPADKGGSSPNAVPQLSK